MGPLRFAILALATGLVWGCATQPPATKDPIEPDSQIAKPPPSNAAAAEPCQPTPVDPASKPAGHGWGLDPENTRFQTETRAALPRTLVPKLRVIWSLPPQPGSPSAQPAMFGDTLIIGRGKAVVAVDAATGCERWSGRYGGNVTAGFANAGWGSPQPLIFFGDDRGHVVAVDGRTGALRWNVELDGRSNTQISGAPANSDGIVYTSFRIGDEGETKPGGIVALDAETGSLIWKSDGRGGNSETELAFLSSPTIDTERGLLYALSGPSEPASRGAVLALDIQTGQTRWRFDLESPNEARASLPPVLVRVEEGDILVVAHGSGTTYGIDPTTGDWIWERRFDSSARIGLAALGDTVIVPTTTPAQGVPGLFALDAFTGETRWQYRSRSGVIAPTTAFPAGIAALYQNGSLRVHDSDDGSVLLNAQVAATSVAPTVQTAGPAVADGRIVLVTSDGAVVALAP